jgi:hypothetical protein
MDKDKVIRGYDSIREGVKGDTFFIIFYLPTFDLVGERGYMSFLEEVRLCIDM